MNNNGFSLIELVITVVIIAVLFGLALPSFNQSMQSTRVRSTASALVDSLHLARTMAVTKSHRVTIRPFPEWSLGWQIFVDANEDGLLSPLEAEISQHHVASGVRVEPDMTKNTYISYAGSGETQQLTGGMFGGTIRVCPTGENSDGIVITISMTGRVRTAKTQPGDCIPS